MFNSCCINILDNAWNSVQSSGLGLDSQSTGLGLDSQKWLAVQWKSSGLDWTGLDWTPVDWILYQPIWPGKMGTGIQWSPVESSGVHMDYVGEGKDLG